MDRGQFNIAVFLDLQKAFDTVNHNILIKKLDLYATKTCPKSFRIILREQISNVCCERRIVKKYLVTCGIPKVQLLGHSCF
jgi:hypothetical protein